MKKTTLLLLLMACAAPAFAQQQLGFLLGGSKRFYHGADKWKLSNSVKEVWWGTEIEPQTMLRIKAGEFTAPTGVVSAAGVAPGKGRIEHIDAVVDYRFSEIYGTTGLFLGAGLYRQKSGGGNEGTDWGWSAGVNGDFPINRHYGATVEATYHSINYSYKPRYLTVGVGLRVKF
jgi:hypothetical protein